MIKGETVILLAETITGTDGFGRNIVTTSEIEVHDVLVGNPSTDDEAQALDIDGKKLIFVLGIPKGDTHDWKDKDVIIRGQKFRTFGYPLLQTEANVPLRWNLQVKVEAHE